MNRTAKPANARSDLMAPAVTLVLLGACLLLSWWILRPFLKALIWALILAYVTWPLFERLCARLRGRRAPASALLTGCLALMAVFLIGWIGWRLQVEMSAFFSQGPATRWDLTRLVERFPWLAAWLETELGGAARSVQLQDYLWKLLQRYSHQLLDVLRSVERHVLVFLFTFLSLFFIYRDGAVLLRQTRRTLCALLGERAIPYLHRIGQTLEAVIYGLVLTALGQGLMAALGYALAGLGAPLLLGLFTGLVALIPFAAPLAWGGVSLWVVFAGKLWTGIVLFGWGLLVMLVVDNFIRPLLISQATRIHFLIVLYGVLGGIECFGLLGLFLGPVILSVMVAIWEEWLAHVHSRQRTEKD